MTPVTLLRASAAMLGLYAFLVAPWVDTSAIREWVNRPLGLGEDFGPLAIMLLLVCTGYTAAVTGFHKSRLAIVVLPLLVAAALAAVVELAGWTVWTVHGGTPLVPLAWVTGLQLVAWLVTLDQRLWPTTVALLVAIGVACLFADGLPQLAFLPLVLVGHVVWRVLDRALPVWAGMLLGAGCLAAVMGVDRNFAGLAQWWYPVAATYAVLLFLVAARPGPTADAIAAQPVVRWLGGGAEWLLLVGPVVGFAVLGLVNA
jgi:hypothetical protein